MLAFITKTHIRAFLATLACLLLFHAFNTKFRSSSSQNTQNVDILSQDISSKRVTVAMIGYNVDHELPKILNNINQLSKHFLHPFRLIFVENFSDDKTLQVFNETVATLGIMSHVISFENLWGAKSMAALSHARNMYLDAIVSNRFNAYTDMDWLIVTDSDMCDPWHVNRTLQVLSRLAPFEGNRSVGNRFQKERFSWGALFANGVCGWYSLQGNATPPFTPHSQPFYCDRYAFADDKINVDYHPKLFWESPFISPHKTCSVPPGKYSGWDCNLLQQDGSIIKSKVKHDWESDIPNVEPLIRVDSAFGGWGLYSIKHLRPHVTLHNISHIPNHIYEVLETQEVEKRSMVQPCRHDPSSFNCEHLSFNACLKNKLNLNLWIANRLVVDWEGCDPATK